MHLWLVYRRDGGFRDDNLVFVVRAQTAAEAHLRVRHHQGELLPGLACKKLDLEGNAQVVISSLGGVYQANEIVDWCPDACPNCKGRQIREED